MFTDVAIEILKNNWSMLFIFITIIVSLRLTYLINNKKSFIFYQEVFALAFIVYILSLFYVVTFQDVSWSSSNFIPFKEILRYEIWSAKFIRNVIGNMIAFIPYGFYVSYLIKINKIYLITFLTLVTSLAIEFTQLSIGRVFDVDDIILNVLGGIIGYIIYRFIHFIKEKLPKPLRTDTFYNIVVVTGLILIIMYILSYLKVGI